ncbi:MAG: TIGR03756 family integrating conjugative element protein [Betaproteobacteria bacterium]|nr:TIGR03756 family integrating conjugative element protein [Betaproteobacteria bacterium]
MRIKPVSRALILSLAVLSGNASALKTDQIIESTLSVDCLDWRVVGICFWLYCTYYECEIRTSTKYRHYVPDAVVSSYAVTGENPWEEVREMSQTNNQAQGGEWYTTNEAHENNLAMFKNSDVIGHPGGAVFSEMMKDYSYSCPGAGTMFFPYFLSVLDVSWRQDLPEALYPASMIPGLREITDLTQTWGNVHPRTGFLHQSDDYKSGAVIAQRSGDIVTRNLQPHVYWPLLAKESPGYWPAGELIEHDAKTGKWQELTPTLSTTCAVFPHSGTQTQATYGDYAWALWRPYACCERKGQVFLFSIDFDTP